MLNEIAAKQNAERGQQLLRARQQTYSRATLLQIIQFVSAVLVPTIGAVLGLLVPSLRAFVGAIALLILVVDIIVLDRWMRHLLRLAAQISEQFDCEVLEMPWNSMLVGAKPQPEDIQHAASAYPQSTKASEAIWDWYPPVVGIAPIHIARLVCQRTNLWYDAKLRSRYTHWLIAVPIVFAFLLVVVSAPLNLTFEAIVLTILAPAAPVLVWSLRERSRQSDAVSAQKATIGAADTLLEKVKIEGCSAEECGQRSREFQDAIYARRVNNPLIMPLIYRVYRTQSEGEMNKGAEERLRALGFT